MTTDEEWLPLVDGDGHAIGKARRRDVHGNPRLLHPVVHCLVTNEAGCLLLQLRSRSKDIQPGRWDTSVGGHVGLGESIEAALLREIHEELGVVVEIGCLSYLHKYIMTNSIESELVHTYVTTHEGPFRPEPSEIDELRFWTLESIEGALGTEVFTPNFEDEFKRYRATIHAGSRRA